MTEKERIRVLLIEDDEDDYLIVKKTLSEMDHVVFSLDWTREAAGLSQKPLNQHYDICLMDYRLDGVTGIDLMRTLMQQGFDAPFIFLTGQGDHDVDVLAMKSGAADFLEKDRIDPGMLERSIRYAIERKKHLDALRVSTQNLRILSAKLVDAQEDERRRVAKEIHDGLGSNLVAIKYGLESILIRMQQNKPYREGMTLEQIIDYVKETIEEARRISFDLRPSVLDDMGLSAAIRWICRRYGEIYPNIRVEKRLDPEEIDVPQSLKVVVFRVLQEAMNNVMKHSKADMVHLDVQRTDGRLELEVRDNGQGFDPRERSGREAKGGVGLTSMRERVELSGGALDITSEKGMGAAIHAVWPLG